MRRILFTATVEEEISAARLAVHQENAGLQGKGNVRTGFLVTGSCTAVSVYHLTRYLSDPDNRPDLIVNIGIAGAYDPAIPAGSVVRVLHDRFGEQGSAAREGFQTLFDYETLESNTLPFVDGTLHAPVLAQFLEAYLSEKYQGVSGVTVQGLSDDPARAEEMRRKFAPEIETVDSAAGLYVALMEKIPLLGLRAVSNQTGLGNRTEWKTQEALESLKTACSGLLARLKED